MLNTLENGTPRCYKGFAADFTLLRRTKVWLFYSAGQKSHTPNTLKIPKAQHNFTI